MTSTIEKRLDRLEARIEPHRRGMVIYEAPASMTDAELEAWVAETFPDASPRSMIMCLNRFSDGGPAPRVLEDGTSGPRMTHEEWVDQLN